MNGQQLKNSILQLAIQGKLVPQDPNDEPASVLLGKIRKEKEQLVKAGKLKKKDLVCTPVADDEKPFEIPVGWEWVRLSSLTRYIEDCPHSTAKDEGKGFPLIRTSNIGFNKFVLTGVHRVSESVYNLRNARAIPTAGDLIYAREATAGNIAVIDEGEKFCLGQRTVLISPFKEYIVSSWLAYTMLSPYSYNSLVGKSTGTTVAHVNLADLRPFIIPLPPLAEQYRIVAKIEQLMPLVSEYDKAQAKLDALNDKLPEALKKSILQEAIMGKLVPQDPNDEPASALLDKIRKEKERLVKAGELKKKDLVCTPIADKEKPFEIPDSWAWCRLGDIGVFERGNGIKRDETIELGLPCVRYGEMYTKYRHSPTFDTTISFTSKPVFDKCRKAHKGDLFMALTGENKKDIALAAQYTGEAEVAVGGDLCHFTVLEAYALYFVYLINSNYYSERKELLATGDIIIHISTDKLGSVPIPLPPLAEQRRIVSKIEQLFAELQ